MAMCCIGNAIDEEFERKNCLSVIKGIFSLGGLITIDYDKWDEYYDGGFRVV